MRPELMHRMPCSAATPALSCPSLPCLAHCAQVKHCLDQRGNHLSTRDRLLGRNSIRIRGLKVGRNSIRIRGLKVGQNSIHIRGLKVGRNSIRIRGLEVVLEGRAGARSLRRLL